MTTDLHCNLPPAPTGPVAAPQVPFRKCVTVLITDRANAEIVLIRSKKKGRAWELPGGGFEEGESWEDAAGREAAEEAGATIADVRLIDAMIGYPVPGAPFHSLIFVVHAASVDEPKAGSDAAEARWFSRDEIPWSELSPLASTQALRAWAGVEETGAER